ncbi:iron chaperone [Variovorax sp. GT1P44]|uniref:iron chaperone n=1 Tax=Variovorax sp. GT1P44 TaxID=3443742 RepID=UPI003F46FE8D
MLEDEANQVEMANRKEAPATIDAYISGFPPDVQAILQKIRQTVRNAAPGAEEVISYRMPAFRLNGIIVYFAAFKKHIGIYPPVKGDARLEKAVSPYAGEKGNLRFPLDEPIPFKLIERITQFRLKQNLARTAGRRGTRKRDEHTP